MAGFLYPGILPSVVKPPKHVLFTSGEMLSHGPSVAPTISIFKRGKPATLLPRTTTLVCTCTMPEPATAANPFSRGFAIALPQLEAVRCRGFVAVTYVADIHWEANLCFRVSRSSFDRPTLDFVWMKLLGSAKKPSFISSIAIQGPSYLSFCMSMRTTSYRAPLI